MNPGIYKDISEKDYHALPYLGSSTLKRFKFNPYASQQPFEASDALTKSMQLGSATHKLVLEGRQAYEANYAISPKFNMRTNAGKAEAEAFYATASKNIIDADQAEAVEGMAKSLLDHPASKLMLNKGANEVTVIWQDETTGLMCKARPDDYSNGVAMDLKTCSDVSKFQWSIRDLAYDIQAAHYTEGLVQNGAECEAFVFIAVQSSKTYPVRVGQLTPEHITYAKAEWSRLMGLYVQCQESGIWPNYTIPSHVFDINQLTASDLMEEF